MHAPHPEVIRLPSQRVATRVAFGNDGRYVAVAGRSQPSNAPHSELPLRDPIVNPALPNPGSIPLHDIRNGKSILTLNGGPGDLLGLAMDPQSKWIAGGGEDAHVRVWDLDNGNVRYQRKTPGVVRCIAVSRDGQTIAACCEAQDSGIKPIPETPAPAANTTIQSQGFVVVWQVSDGKELARWPAHDGDALSVAFSPDSLQLASSGNDRTVKVWTLADQKLAAKMDAFDGEIVDLSFRPSGKDLAGVGFDSCRPDKAGDVVVWNVADGHLLAGDKSIRLYDGTTGKDLRKWVMKSYAQSLAVTPNGDRFAVSTGEGAILMGQPNSDEPLKLVAEKLSHSFLTFDSGGAQLAAVETIWGAGQVPVLDSQERPAPSVKPESVSKRQLHLWNVESPHTHRALPLTSSHTPSGIAWDSELKSFVIGGEDGSVVLVDPDEVSQSLRMTGHRDATRILTLPDGRFASFGSENKLNVWRIAPADKRHPDCLECTPPGAATPVLPMPPQASTTPPPI